MLCLHQDILCIFMQDLCKSFLAGLMWDFHERTCIVASIRKKKIIYVREEVFMNKCLLHGKVLKLQTRQYVDLSLTFYELFF